MDPWELRQEICARPPYRSHLEKAHHTRQALPDLVLAKSPLAKYDLWEKQEWFARMSATLETPPTVCLYQPARLRWPPLRLQIDPDFLQQDAIQSCRPNLGKTAQHQTHPHGPANLASKLHGLCNYNRSVLWVYQTSQSQ